MGLDLVGFVVDNAAPIIFYGLVILTIYSFRHKIDWQGKLVGMYKTQVGVPLMKSLSSKHREFFKWLGYCGIGIGFAGMLAIVVMLVHGLWQVFFVPDSGQVIGLVLPGIHVPGLVIAIPLITGWLALFVVIAVHEFSHGVVSKAHKIPIKSSGLLFVGPLLGAFVEPDEKKLAKASDVVQYSVFAAGPFSNILSFAFFLLLAIPLGAVADAMTESGGIQVMSVEEGQPAFAAGLETGMVIVSAQGQETLSREQFGEAFSDLKEGDSVSLTMSDGSAFTMVAGPDKDPDTNKGRIGITMDERRNPVNPATWFSWLMNGVFWLVDFVKWVIILNLGIGLANLLPLGPVDGGQMMRTLQVKLYGKKKGEAIWKKVSLYTAVLLVVLLVFPFLKLHLF